MTVIELNMYQTVAVAALVLLLGRFVSDRCGFFRRYCIPDPVVGGVIYAIVHMILRTAGIVEISLDTTLQTFFMLIFYTGIGFGASFKLLKNGGKMVFVFLILSTIMCILQNVTGAGIAAALGVDPLYGILAGSIPMVGGHATAVSFAPVFEAEGVVGAEAVAVASATFGLVAGCAIGGPIATRRIKQFNLHSTEKGDDGEKEEKHGTIDSTRFLNAMLFLVIATGIGTYICKYLQGLTIMGRPFSFPQTIGGLIAGVVVRNVWDMLHKELPMEELDTIGGYSLSLFLGVAMINLKLWELTELALPMIVILLGQTVLMAIVSYFIIFNFMGRNYDAAVITTGFCGFGMGASPNAMANMQAVTTKYGPAPTAIFVVSIVAALFIDFTNSIVITAMMNIL